LYTIVPCSGEEEQRDGLDDVEMIEQEQVEVRH
jgi:hypothetical protein